MFTYEEFKVEIERRLKKAIGLLKLDYEIVPVKVNKVNETLEGYTFKKIGADKTHCRAVFYLKDLYEYYCKGDSMKFITEMLIKKGMFEAPPAAITKPIPFETCKEKLSLQLINKAKNQALLEEVPYTEFSDFAVIYRMNMEETNGYMRSAIITNEILKMWGMNVDELHEAAMAAATKHLPYLLKNLDSIVKCEGEKVSTGMHCLSNSRMYYGASVILYPGVLEAAAEVFGGDYYILPGSLHELYLIEADENCLEAMRIFVQAANRELVETEEWLSDEVYVYRKETGMIEVA